METTSNAFADATEITTDSPTKEKGKKNTQQLEKVKENAEKIIDLSTITTKEKIPINKC